MSDSRRLLPLTGYVGSAWVWGSLLAPGLVVPVVVLVLAFPEWFFAAAALFYIAPYTILPAGCIAWPWFRERLRCARRAELARALGLAFQQRVREDDVEPFAELPLFRFSRDGSYRAAYQMEGIFDGRRILVMDLCFVAPFPERVNIKVLRRSLQTIAVLWVGSSLPDFHLAPQINDWDELDPDWPCTLALGRVVLDVNPFSRDPSVIRSRNPEAVRRLFAPARLEKLGPIRGWTIECLDGQLLIYRHREVLTVEELPYFVTKVVDLANVLTQPLEDEIAPVNESIQAGLSVVARDSEAPATDRPSASIQPTPPVRSRGGFQSEGSRESGSPAH